MCVLETFHDCSSKADYIKTSVTTKGMLLEYLKEYFLRV
jgi:hypothetical protein